MRLREWKEIQILLLQTVKAEDRNLEQIANRHVNKPEVKAFVSKWRHVLLSLREPSPDPAIFGRDGRDTVSGGIHRVRHHNA
jgi:hypothetical protein